MLHSSQIHVRERLFICWCATLEVCTLIIFSAIRVGTLNFTVVMCKGRREGLGRCYYAIPGSCGWEGITSQLASLLYSHQNTKHYRDKWK
jgi:hypothetical protein